jgi:hypothetical protein
MRDNPFITQIWQLWVKAGALLRYHASHTKADGILNGRSVLPNASQVRRCLERDLGTVARVNY